jgi:flavin-dependent dehydrogenase
MDARNDRHNDKHNDKHNDELNDKPNDRHNHSDLVLQDGARIAVVGAGPAGCFFAYFAAQAATRRGIALNIVLYDGKTFARGGPAGCNMCAGVVAPTLVHSLEGMGIDLPEPIVQRRIDRYWLETPVGRLALFPPPDQGSIYTMFRGNGPRGAAPGGNISFDEYLLTQVRQMGVSVVNEPVTGLRLRQGPAGKAAVVRQSGAVDEVDLIVGAFGVHGPLARMVADLGFGYVPPPITHGYQAEIWLGADEVVQRLGNAVHIFSLGLKGISFAALTPKREHATVTLVGESAGPQTLAAFLNHPLVRAYLPPGWTQPADFCHCRPRIPMGTCRHPYTDRLVVIGDASNSRLYKNGLESAYVTGKAAAETAVEHGVSAADFKHFYYPTLKSIAQDSRFGRALFWIKDHIILLPPLAKMLVGAAARERELYPAGEQFINQALWGMFTGDQSYRWILGTILRPAVVARFLRLGLPALVGRGGPA